jgi:hypothetical protein
MSLNQILRRRMLGEVMTTRGELQISAATQTSVWVRPDFVAEAMRAPLAAAVVANESVLPSNTAEVVAR